MSPVKRWMAPFLILIFSAAVQAAERLNVVFDLDWTLIYPTTAEMQKAQPQHVIEVDGQLFRLADHAMEVIRTLHETSGVQVSFFSGGSKERNQKVVDALYQEINRGRTDKLKPFLVLNKDQMQVVSTDTSLKFWQRYQKDLTMYFDLHSTILVDDMRELLPESQRQSLLWLERTYNDRPLYELKSLEDPKAEKYSAPNFEEWQKERQKLVRALGLILTARDISMKNSLAFDEGLQRALQMEKKGAVDPVKKAFGRMQIPMSCHKMHKAS